MALLSKNKVWVSALFVVLGSLIIGTAQTKAATPTSVTVTARYYAEVNDDFKVGDFSLTYSTIGNNAAAGYDFINGRNTDVVEGAVYIAFDNSGKVLWYGNNNGQGGVVRLAKLQSIIPTYSPTIYNRQGVAVVKNGVYAVYDQKNDTYIKVRVLNVTTTADSVSNTNLSTPSLVYPSNYQTFTNYPRTLNLQWNGVDSAHHYEVRIECNLCQGTDAWKQVGYYTSAQTTFSPPALPFDTDYRWQVRAIDTAGRASNWSNFAYFSSHTIYPALSAPTLSSPVNDAFYYTYPRTFTAQWGAVSNARSYILEINCSTCGTGNWSVVNFYFPSEGATTYPITVTGEGNQRLRIQSIDQYGNHSPWSEFTYFRTGTTIIDPGRPGLITGSSIITTPTSYSTVPSSETSLNLNWTAVPNARNYRVEVSCDTCSGSNTWWHLYDTVDGEKNFSLPLSDVPYGSQRYRVVVQGLNLPNVGPYSSPIYFYYNRTNSNGTGTSLAQVTNLTYSLDYPARAANVAWNAVPGATNYLVEVLCNSCGSNYGWNSYLSNYSDNGATNIRFRIPENKQYQVRVRAGNSSQNGPWSNYLNFNATTPTGVISAPVITSAAIDINGTLSANWNNVPGAIQYFVTVNCIYGNVCAVGLDRGFFTNYSYLSTNQITGLSTTDSYRIRVYSIDANRSYSQPSAEYVVRYQGTVLPSVPRIITPLAKQILTNFPRTISPRWEKVDSARRYIVEIDCDYCSSYTKWSGKPYRYVSDDYATSLNAITLPGDNEYRIRIKAVDQNGLEGPWSENLYFSFRT